MPPLGFLLTEAKSLTLSALPLLKKLPQQASTHRNMQGERWSEWSWTSWRSSQDNPDFFSFQLFHSATKTWSIHAIHIHDSDLSDAEIKRSYAFGVSNRCNQSNRHFTLSKLSVSGSHLNLILKPLAMSGYESMDSLNPWPLAPWNLYVALPWLSNSCLWSLFQRFSQLNTKTNQKSSISWCVFSVILIWIKGFCFAYPLFQKATFETPVICEGCTPVAWDGHRLWHRFHRFGSCLRWCPELSEKKLSKQIENRWLLSRLSRLSHPTLAHLAWQVTSAKTSNFPPDLFAFHFATQIPTRASCPDPTEVVQVEWSQTLEPETSRNVPAE